MNHDNPYNIWNRWLETYVEDLKDTGGGKVSEGVPAPIIPTSALHLAQAEMNIGIIVLVVGLKATPFNSQKC